MIEASAPGKAILLGEHAVVYDQPALAVPLPDLRTLVSIQQLASDRASIYIEAIDLDQSFWLHERGDRDPLACATRLALAAATSSHPESLQIQIRSSIPIAAGLGSGAATSVAIIRAIAAYFDTSLADQSISDMAFQVEKLHHGTPSGIDNTVISFEKPLYFQQKKHCQTFVLGKDLQLVLGHCGVTSQTGDVVAGVRKRWQAETMTYDALFKEVGDMVNQAYRALIEGKLQALGELMNANHSLLQSMAVSQHELDALVESARDAGALGAKLTGAGAGGFMIALVEPSSAGTVLKALVEAGAQHAFTTKVST